MNENEFTEEFINNEDEEFAVNDKRRFDADGAKGQPTVAAQAEVSLIVKELEARLLAETQRREAAETKLVGVQAKFDEAKNNLEKETAEMRTRLMKTLEDRAKQAQFSFLSTLLPVLDNLNFAVTASETDGSFENLKVGIQGTARSFEQALINVGVEPIGATGQIFDPELHEAVDIVPVASEDDGKVIAEYQKGFRFGNQLLRAARVQVGKG